MILLWILTAVAGLVVALLALLLVLLAVPLGVRLTRTEGSERITVKVHWLFGVVRIPLTGRKPSAPGTKKRGRQRDAGKQGGRKHGADDRSRRPFPGEFPAIVRAVTTLLKRVLRRFKVSADGDVRIGLSDPADTGILWGSTAPILLRFTERVGLRVQPSFAGADFSFTGRAAVDVVPVTVVLPVLRLVLSHDGRVVIGLLRERS